ncbi:hypothetical protein QSV34_11220 [Porticoccus sp. W117]|uniref:hypothetical protein n=1 Tax=Porticoccus sp. W117 TaxID=3054777 RepID=UPI002593017B|nr:hypothetical protein [Porticoccus sp. W117]MDM3871918.1 hypothetical protein [Porticoccus sp. W117]
MRNLPTFLIGLFVSVFVFWLLADFNSGNSDYTIVIVDNSGCESPRYMVTIKNQSVVVEGDQISYDSLVAPNGAKAQITVPSLLDTEGVSIYKIMASYANCNAITSKERSVKPGWILYEFIDKNKIKHEIRSK